MAKKIGKGISQLLANVEDERKREDIVSFIKLSEIRANPKQPRKSFNDESIKELADSIKEHGIIQPLVLKRDGENYIIVAGERRFRAATLVGLKEIPAIIKELSDQKTREISLIENLQREDLNAIEAAEGLKELMDIYSLTQEELAARIGKARSSIANTLRLLLLEKKVKQLVREDKLSAGHAKSLIPITDAAVQLSFANEAIEQQLSVREMEKKVRFYLHPEKQPKKMNPEQKTKLNTEMRAFVDGMKRTFMTKVKLIGNEEKGRIIIDYFTNDDLQRIHDLIARIKEEK